MRRRQRAVELDRALCGRLRFGEHRVRRSVAEVPDAHIGFREPGVGLGVSGIERGGATKIHDGAIVSLPRAILPCTDAPPVGVARRQDGTPSLSAPGRHDSNHHERQSCDGCNRRNSRTPDTRRWAQRGGGRRRRGGGGGGGGGGRRMTQCGDEVFDFRIRLHLELLPHKRLVLPCLLHSAGAVSGHSEREHQLLRCAR